MAGLKTAACEFIIKGLTVTGSVTVAGSVKVKLDAQRGASLWMTGFELSE